MSSNANGTSKSSNNTARSSVIPWERDADYALNLNANRVTSAELLLRWLTTPHNLDMYRGEQHPDVPRKNKATVLKEIVDYFKQNGIEYRKVKNIRSRIDRMMNTYREAVEWETKYNDGTLEDTFYHSLVGKTEEQKQYEIKAQILRICKEYDRIHPFLINATWPPPTTSSNKGKSKPTISLDTDDEDSEDENDESSPLPEPSTSTFIPIKKRDTPIPETTQVALINPPAKKKRVDDTDWRQEYDAHQLAQIVVDTEIKRAELELKQIRANSERENMLADIMIKKNKAALESLKFMHEEGLLTKEEFKEKCFKIVEQYNGN